MTSPTGPCVPDIGWRFDNTYARLPQAFFERVLPLTFPQPRLCILNYRLGDELGLDLHSLSEASAAALFSGQELPSGSEVIAQAYAGHQFGGFTMLGDGRAMLLGEHCIPKGKRVDIQYKGSGPTPYSRRGDGRAALGPMLREYLISEAMHALGIPTTRSLAVVTTGEPVYRERMLQGAVLTRVAESHIRVGTFQYLAAFGHLEHLRMLADYAIERHYPELIGGNEKYLALLSAVAERQAALISRWQMVGFVHGVMNTDNMAISGETIDFGPCAFMDRYHPETVFSSIDAGGRYAYGNQPRIAQWNLARFAESLLPLIDPNPQKAVELATSIVQQFADRYEQYWLAGMRKKLGLDSQEPNDSTLIQSLLDWMQTVGADFTITFDDLSGEIDLNDGLYRDPVFQNWYSSWQERLHREGLDKASVFARMQSVNPFLIPRNHRVEECLSAAVEHQDISLLHRFLDALQSPYHRDALQKPYRDPPPADLPRYRTFCGT